MVLVVGLGGGKRGIEKKRGEKKENKEQKQNKTKQNKTKQNKTKQNKTKQNKNLDRQILKGSHNHVSQNIGIISKYLTQHFVYVCYDGWERVFFC